MHILYMLFSCFSFFPSIITDSSCFLFNTCHRRYIIKLQYKADTLPSTTCLCRRKASYKIRGKNDSTELWSVQLLRQFRIA